MKRILFVTLALMLLASAAAAAPASKAAATTPRAAGAHRPLNQTDSSIQPAESALPTISKYQAPHAVPNIGCGAGYGVDGGTCTQDDGDSGSGLTGGCSCSRICYEGVSTCHLADRNIGCIAGLNGALCKSCSGQCYKN